MHKVRAQAEEEREKGGARREKPLCTFPADIVSVLSGSSIYAVLSNGSIYEIDSERKESKKIADIMDAPRDARISGEEIYVLARDRLYAISMQSHALTEMSLPFGEEGASVMEVEGNRIALGGYDGTLVVLDSGAEILRCNEHAEYIKSIVMVGTCVYTCGEDGLIHRIDVRSGRLKDSYDIERVIVCMYKKSSEEIAIVDTKGTVYLLVIKERGIRKVGRPIKKMREVFRTMGQTYLLDKSGCLYLLDGDKAEPLRLREEFPEAVFLHRHRLYFSKNNEIRSWAEKGPSEFKEFFSFL